MFQRPFPSIAFEQNVFLCSFNDSSTYPSVQMKPILHPSHEGLNEMTLKGVNAVKMQDSPFHRTLNLFIIIVIN